jgi:selenide,water dikinase
LPVYKSDKLLIGFDTGDDGSVYRISDDLAVINTIDFFTPVVDDPFQYGTISAANSISDIYAMGGKPISALNVIGFHQGKVMPEIVREIILGGADKAIEAQCVVSGGHTIQDIELKYGMAVTGLVHPDKIWRNDTIQSGDVLILTKPLGTGAVSTALKQGKASEKDVSEIVKSMQLLNKIPSEILQQDKYDVHACTDVTGYGLAGHLSEMLGNNSKTIVLQKDSLPRFDCLDKYISEYAFLPGGFYNNRNFVINRLSGYDNFEDPAFNILFDPQTSGGLVFSLSRSDADEFLRDLKKSDYPFAGWEIGYISAEEGNTIRVE